MLDGRLYYHLENYVYSDVHDRFHNDGTLSTFDFLSIINWARPDGSFHVGGLLRRQAAEADDSLAGIVEHVSAQLAGARSARDRVAILVDQARLPIWAASAVLAVLWPMDFARYDRRVCAVLGAFEDVERHAGFEAIWEGYGRYCAELKGQMPEAPSLREAVSSLIGIHEATSLSQQLAIGFLRSKKSGHAPRTSSSQSLSGP